MWRTQLKSTCSLSQRNLDFFLFPIDIVKCLINVLLVSDSMCVLQSIGFPLPTLASRFSLYFQMLEVCDPLMFPLFPKACKRFAYSVHPTVRILSFLPQCPCRMWISSLIWKMSPGCRLLLNCLTCGEIWSRLRDFLCANFDHLASVMKELSVVNINAKQYELN